MIMDITFFIEGGKKRELRECHSIHLSVRIRECHSIHLRGRIRKGIFIYVEGQGTSLSSFRLKGMGPPYWVRIKCITLFI
jgi:hypothetical protein